MATELKCYVSDPNAPTMSTVKPPHVYNANWYSKCHYTTPQPIVPAPVPNNECPVNNEQSVLNVNTRRFANRTPELGYVYGLKTTTHKCIGDADPGRCCANECARSQSCHYFALFTGSEEADITTHQCLVSGIHETAMMKMDPVNVALVNLYEECRSALEPPHPLKEDICEKANNTIVTTFDRIQHAFSPMSVTSGIFSGLKLHTDCSTTQCCANACTDANYGGGIVESMCNIFTLTDSNCYIRSPNTISVVELKNAQWHTPCTLTSHPELNPDQECKVDPVTTSPVDKGLPHRHFFKESKTVSGVISGVSRQKECHDEKCCAMACANAMYTIGKYSKCRAFILIDSQCYYADPHNVVVEVQGESWYTECHQDPPLRPVIDAPHPARTCPTMVTTAYDRKFSHSSAGEGFVYGLRMADTRCLAITGEPHAVQCCAKECALHTSCHYFAVAKKAVVDDQVSHHQCYFSVDSDDHEEPINILDVELYEECGVSIEPPVCEETYIADGLDTPTYNADRTFQIRPQLKWMQLPTQCSEELWQDQSLEEISQAMHIFRDDTIQCCQFNCARNGNCQGYQLQPRAAQHGLLGEYKTCAYSTWEVAPRVENGNDIDHQYQACRVAK